MAFVPTPLPLIKNHFGKILPCTITWDQPDEMFLVGNPQPADGGPPLPFVQPFVFSGNLIVEGTYNQATLSIKPSEFDGVCEACVTHRLVDLTMDVDGAPQHLLVQLTSV